MENIKKSYKNNNTISAPTWNEEFELSYGSSSVSDIKYYFEHIVKTVKTYVNKIENITFKIKTGYYVKLLTLEIMKLLGTNKVR